MTENERQQWALIIRYQALLAQARTRGDVSGEHMALLGLGASYFELGRWLEAREHLTPVLAWLSAQGYWLLEMEQRELLAYACFFDDQAGLALEHFTALRERARANGVSSREGEGLLGCARSLSALGRDAEAVRAYREALALLASPVLAGIRSQALYELGFDLRRIGRAQEAVPLLEEALALAREQGELRDEARNIALLGVTLLGIRGREQHGIDRLIEALAVFRQLGDRREQAKTLADLGLAHLQHRSASARGLREGARYLEEAEALARAVDDRALLGAVLETRGRVDERLGEMQGALSAFRRASALDPHTRPVERLRNIGRVFQQLGQSGSALEFDRKALLAALAAGDTGAEMEQLLHLCDDCLEQGAFAQACAYQERAIGLALTRGGDDALTGRLHLRLAQLLFVRTDKKQPVRALALWRIGTLYAQGEGGASRFRGDWHTLIHPVREMVEVLGRRAFLPLWQLSETAYQQMLAAEDYAPSLARVGALLGQEDPFAFLDVEPLTAFLFNINTAQLREWIRDAIRAGVPDADAASWPDAIEQFFAGVAAEERGDWEAASDHYAGACALVPTFAEACTRLGALLAEEWLDTEALTYLDRAIELAPDMWQAFYARGHAYTLFYEHERAIADYTAALQLNPSARTCRYERAAAYLEVGDAEAAMLDSADVTSADRSHRNAWLVHGRALLDMGRPDQAGRVFTDMIEYRRFGEQGDIYFYRGIAFLWLGNAARAKADFTRSWREWKEVKARLMLIWLAWGEAKPGGRAISTWNKVAAAHVGDWYGDLVSLLLKLVRDPDETVPGEFDQLMDVEPRRFEAPFWKGMACAALGRREESAQLWESALQLGMPPHLLGPLRWLEQDCPACWDQARALLDRFQVQLASDAAQG
jgi:tetratricopeptide (TPR) repeat protein